MFKEVNYNFPELIFDISDLYRARSGVSVDHKIKLKLEFIDDEKLHLPKSELTGDIALIKTEDSIEVVLSNIDLDAEVACDRCLKKFTQHIHIESSERTFFLDEKDAENEDDMFIDKKRLQLDANELLRQEIILHFPIILVCSDGCQGLGDYNKEVISKQRKPLSDLKDMWKNNN